MENSQQPKQNGNEKGKTTFLVLGIIFIFLPGFNFLGVIFLLIYFFSSSNNSGNIVNEIKKDLEDVEYEIKDEDVTNEEEEMYRQIEEQIKNNEIKSENQIEIQNNETIHEQKGVTFDDGAINKSEFGKKDNGPIKYY